jgi:RHS repeat-associated protein
MQMHFTILFRRIRIVALTICWLCSLAAGQVDQSANFTSPLAIYHGTDVDNVSLPLHNLHLSLPVVDQKGRGIDFQVVVTYNSQMWQTTQQTSGNSTGNGVAYITSPRFFDVGGNSLAPNPWNIAVPRMLFGASPIDKCQGTDESGNCTSHAFYQRLWTSEGSIIELVDQVGVRSGLVVPYPQTIYWSNDGTYMRTSSSVSLQKLLYRDGVSLNMQYTPQIVNTLEDTNGNFITCLGVNGNSFNTCSDTLNRVITFNHQNLTSVNGPVPVVQSITYQDSNGVTQTIGFTWQMFRLDVPWASSPDNGDPNCAVNVPAGKSCYFIEPAAIVSNPTAPLLTKISLANGLSYEFEYVMTSTGATTGEISKLTLPTGGYVKYQYSCTLTTCPYPQAFFPGDAPTGIVADRIVSSDGTAASEQTWSYLGFFDPANPNWDGHKITDPLGNVQASYWDPPGTCAPAPHRVDYKDSKGTLLKQVLNTLDSDNSSYHDLNSWPACNNPRITSTTTVLNDTSQQSQTSSTFGPFGNVVDQYEYDWGAGTPGALLRHTNYQYLHDSNSAYGDSAAHILNRPITQIVYDGAGTTLAQTATVYDGATPSATSNIVQHDYTNFPASNTVRGNPTQVKHWLNSTGSWLTTTNVFNDVGNLVQSTDPNGNPTSFSYADNYYNFTPPQPTSAFISQVTRPVTNNVNHVSRSQYYFGSGLPAAKCGENLPSGTACAFGLTGIQPDYASFTFDGMGRMLAINRGDGGRTTVSYNEATLPISIADNVAIDASHNLTGTAVYDGLGRRTQTQLNSDPAGVDFIDTAYDGLGRKATVSNPYRSTSDATYGVMQSRYDALGRINQVTQQDGGLSTASFSGNCVTSTDEAGDQRRSCRDSLGRLIRVEEPGGSSPSQPARGSIDIGPILTTQVGGHGATPGAGSVTITGNEQSKSGVGAIPGTPGTGSVTMGGPGEQYYSDGTVSIADGGTVVVGINGSGGASLIYQDGYVGCPASHTSGWSGDVQTAVTYVANCINANTSYVTATVSGYTVNITANGNGSNTNYTLSAYTTYDSSQGYTDPNTGAFVPYFSQPSLTATASGSSLTGGTDGNPGTTVYDSGACKVTINGTDYSAGFGQGATSSSIATALATAISGGSLASASASGATISLTTKTSGAASNYSLSGSCTYNSSVFTSPSFAANASSANLTGGTDAYGGTSVTDHGSVTLTAGSFTTPSVPYGPGSANPTAASVAAALTAGLSGRLEITAASSGTVIAITYNTLGTAGNGFAVSVKPASADPSDFPSPSFSVSPIALSGGANANPGSLSTPYVTLYQYDALGNLLCAVQKASDTTAFSSCAAAPSAWRPRSFTYDSLSRLLAATNPESGSISYTYDADGNLLQKTSPAPNQTGSATQTVSYCYDALNRVTGKAYSAQTCTNGFLPAGTAAVSYAYDAGTNGIGRLTSLTDQAGSGSYAYDVMGRPASESRTIAGVSKSMSYTYNLDGSLKTMTYPSGAVITYTPDAAGRDVSAVDTANGINYVTGATYGPDSAVTGFVNGNVITNSFSYNKRLQPVFMSASSPSQTVFSIGYDFHLGNGDNDNVYALTNNRDHTRDQVFAYDALNRLTSAQNAGTDCTKTTVNGKTQYWSNNYAYDAWGNLLSKSIIKCGAENLSLTADTQNRVHVKTGADYQYDAAGNMTYDAVGQYYSYDQENRISGAGGFTYTYDADGDRVKKSNGSTGTLYWYMSPGIVAESDLAGNLQSEYVFFDGERVARRDGPNGAGGVFYYFSDHLKTASVITDSAGNIKAESDYYPWGGELQFINNDSNHYKFTGKERDAETQLDYFGARYYSNGLGRFITADWSATPVAVPYADLSNPQTLNLYRYPSNPESYADLDGHQQNCQILLCPTAPDPNPEEVEKALESVKRAEQAAEEARAAAGAEEAAAAGQAAARRFLGLAGATYVLLDLMFPDSISAGDKPGFVARDGAQPGQLEDVKPEPEPQPASGGATRGPNGETLSRLGTSKESAARLGRKAAEAEEKIGIHGVSTTAGQPTAPASSASRSSVEGQFKVHDTPTRNDPLHRTVELPKPVTQRIADIFNKLFGR